jgi:TetR/AcrR family transcriptional repressor of nem operon
MIETLSGILPGATKRDREEQAIATIATLVGSMVLARAVDDPRRSDLILKATATELKRRFAGRWDFVD